MTAIAFTATRSVPSRGIGIMWKSVFCIRDTIERPLKFVTGAAHGGDTFLALACLFCFPKEEHLIAVPDYEHNEILVATLTIWKQMNSADNLEIVYTGLPPLDRNDYMLDRAEALFAFPQTAKEQMRGSGTWATIRHARLRSMPIFVHPLSGERPWKEHA